MLTMNVLTVVNKKVKNEKQKNHCTVFGLVSLHSSREEGATQRLFGDAYARYGLDISCVSVVLLVLPQGAHRLQ